MNVKKLSVILVIAVLILVTIGVAIKNQTDPGEDYGTISNGANSVMTQWITITIDGNPVTVDAYSQDIWYDVRQLTTERDLTITASDFTGCTVTVNGVPIEPNGTASLRLERMNALEGIEICVTNAETQSQTRNYIRTLPMIYSSATILSNDPEDGYYYFNLNNYLFKTDTKGNVVFYKQLDGNVLSGYDFKRTEVDGKVYYSYLASYEPADNAALEGVGYLRCYAVVLDENYNEIDRVWCLVETDGRTTVLENHQFTILGEKHYLVSAYVGKRVMNIPQDVPHSQLGARVVADVIQEIKDGQVIWEWDSTEHPELYALSVESNDFYNETVQWADYAHFNAIAVDPRDQNLVCSFRNLDAILKLDRTTGEILWILGGSGDQFGLTEAQQFSHQHDIRVTEDGAYTLFNNGNADDTMENGATSILKFYLDEENKTVTDFESYSVEKSFSGAMGSAQELSKGHYVISWGQSVSPNTMFSEIDFAENTVRFEFCYPGTAMNYRVYKDIA